MLKAMSYMFGLLVANIPLPSHRVEPSKKTPIAIGHTMTAQG